MLVREVKVGHLYKHFKGNVYRIVCVARDSESLEEKVVYNHDGTDKFWIRNLEEFLSEVDHEKYPDVEQQYRFEEIN